MFLAPRRRGKCNSMRSTPTPVSPGCTLISFFQIYRSPNIVDQSQDDLQNFSPEEQVGGKRKRGRPKKDNARRRALQMQAKTVMNTPEAISKRSKTIHSKTVHGEALNKLRNRNRIEAPNRLIEEVSVEPEIVRERPVGQRKARLVDTSPNEEISKQFTVGANPIINFCMTAKLLLDQLDEITVWATKWSHASKEPNMTATKLKEHIYETTSIVITNRACCRLLKELGFCWKTLLPGYYFAKAMDPWVILHRTKVIEVLEYMITHPNWFQLFYQDECAFRTNIYQNKGVTPCLSIVILTSYSPYLLPQPGCQRQILAINMI